MKANNHATMHWKITTNIAQPLPISFLIAAIVATHGTYNKQKTSSDNALIGFKYAVNSVIENNTLRVETTASLAKKPVTRATTIFQFPKPQGANIGATILAMLARIDFSALSTIDNFHEKFCSAQMIIDAKNITLNALCKKSFVFSHNSWLTFLALGSLYEGNSITKGIASPLKIVFLNMKATSIPINIPIKYNPVMIRPAYLGKKVLVKKA